MPDLTIRYVSAPCTNHITFNVLLNGVIKRKIAYTRDELMSPVDLEYDELLLWLMREACRAAGADTLAECRTAIEAKTWSV